MVVYANTFTRTEEDAEGQEIEREIPFLKGYTVLFIAVHFLFLRCPDSCHNAVN